MISRNLILFCGGPAIYTGGVPKPLYELQTGQKLISLYLNQRFAQSFETVTLLCEQSQVAEFEKIGEAAPTRFEVKSTQDGSTTFEKLTSALETISDLNANVVCTYPDIFYFGVDSPMLDAPEIDGRFSITVRPLMSRFPRLMIDPYSGVAKSISDHQSAVPANPVYMFGGHLIAQAGDLTDAISEFRGSSSARNPSLELDFLGWLINRDRVNTCVLRGDWIQCDSVRDEIQLLAMVNSD